MKNLKKYRVTGERIETVSNPYTATVLATSAEEARAKVGDSYGGEVTVTSEPDPFVLEASHGFPAMTLGDIQNALDNAADCIDSEQDNFKGIWEFVKSACNEGGNEDKPQSSQPSSAHVERAVNTLKHYQGFGDMPVYLIVDLLYLMWTQGRDCDAALRKAKDIFLNAREV